LTHRQQRGSRYFQKANHIIDRSGLAILNRM
jgi:hypothetical protein